MKAKQGRSQWMQITAKEEGHTDERCKKVLKIFSEHKSNRILDIGCGDGNFSDLLKKACRANEVCGVDISEKAIEAAKKNGVNALQLDIDENDFPFPDNFFDAVHAGEVIEHLYDPFHFLDEIHRTLSETGFLVITTPNLAAIHNRIALLLGYQPFPMLGAKINIGGISEPDSKPTFTGHIRVLTLGSLKQLLKTHKFQIVEVKGSCADNLPENMRLSKIVRGIDRVFTLFPSLSYRAIVLARKYD